MNSGESAAADAHGALTATSIEDVLAGAMWVTSLTDPSLSADRLHEAFMEVIFSFADDAADAQATDDTQQQRLRTAADVERERRLRDELRREAADLRGEDAHAASAPDEEDEELFDEEAEDEEDEQQIEDRAFLDWIDSSQRVARQPPTAEDSERAPDSAAVELELSRVGLGNRQEKAVADVLPERLQEIEVKDRRPMLGPKELPGGFSYSIPLELEAYWVLRQLRNPGQPLAHSTRVCALANRSQAEIADEPLLVALGYAIQKMTREYVEPGQLMMYHQSRLHPLLFALLEGSPLLDAAEHSIPMASLAYSTQTGRRQRPFLSEGFVGFGPNCSQSIGEGDATWRRFKGIDYAQQKPCFIELGRLLVRVLELDSLCHKLEYRRQQLLIMLQDNPEARIQDQRSLLNNVVFESVVEAEIWHSFVQMLIAKRSRGPYHAVRSLGLEDAFEEYTITALQYQENLLSNAPISLCSEHPRMGLYAWAEQVGSVMTPPRSAAGILDLFNSAIVDSFSKLPFLCKQIVDVMCAEGDLIVSYTSVRRKDDIFPLASFLVDHPQHYVELVQKERQGAVKLFYVVEENLIRRILNVSQLYQRVGTTPGDDWTTERAAAMEMLVYQLVDGLVPRVKSELLTKVTYQLDMLSVQRLGVLCAQGPYEPTHLILEAYTDAALTWQPEWNVVEALPTAWSSERDATANLGDENAEIAPTASTTYQLTPRQSSRVCAAFPGNDGITYFAFIDENGTVVGSTRWTECAMNSALGREAALRQSISLEKLFIQCSPSVVAVAASGTGSLALTRLLQDFVRDRILPKLGIDVPIVWAMPEIARFSSETSYAAQELSNMSEAMRTAVALARYVQDPLNVISTLFDARHTIARVFLAGARTTVTHEQEERLFRRLSWEMSLWVASTGFWLDDCVKRPVSIATLQFVGGLGAAKARTLWQDVCKTPVCSRTSLRARLHKLFGQHVAANAQGCIRVAAPEALGEDDEPQWHVLDMTLIPLEWYPVAEAMTSVIMHANDVSAPEDPTAQPLSTALLAFSAKSATEKRNAIARCSSKVDYISAVRHTVRPSGVELISGNREFSLIMDEVVAAGQSTQRRPYRRLSTNELMLGITGVTFVSQSELRELVQRGLASSSALSESSGEGNGTGSSPHGAGPLSSGGVSSFVIKEGDYLTGTVSGVRGGGSVGIRLVTSRGLGAFIALEDIHDESKRAELLEHVQFLEAVREARVSGTPLSDAVMQAHESAAWLRRGALVQGLALRCHWGRCEMLLSWCAPRESETGADSDGQRGSADGGRDAGNTSTVGGMALPYALLTAGSFSRSLASQGAGGVGLLDKAESAYSTKISRHVLFRSFSSTRAQEELRDKEMGEIILRPATGHRTKAVCVVKLGANCTGSWMISEERKFNGNIYYTLRDKMVNRTFTFDEVDELLRNYIGGVVQLVKGVREHRRFVENTRDVSAALADQQRSSGGRGFSYAFVETGVKSNPPLYRVFTLGGGKEYSFRLHFTNRAVYVRLPLAKAANNVGGAEFKWVECQNAEQVSETVKTHARKNSRVA